MKLKCDEPLSNFAFKINLRQYIEGYGDAVYESDEDEGEKSKADQKKNKAEAEAGAYTRSLQSST